jgi:hypothetical protein
MDAKTLKALKGSIKKWQANAKINDLEEAKIKIIDCPLCTLFWDNECFDCPIREKSGQRRCDGTPYVDADGAHNEADLDAFIAASRAEVKFLQSLLPEPKP